MSLQRKRFLLGYLMTLSGGPAGIRIHDLPHGSPMLNQVTQPVGGCQFRKARVESPGSTSVVLILNSFCFQSIIAKLHYNHYLAHRNIALANCLHQVL